MLSYLDMLAIALILIGIFGETISDTQLQRFKRTHPGKVCDKGMWYYSRHPNYFFDWLTWLGFTVFSLQAALGCFSLISIALLYVIFTRITGPITERGSIQTRGTAYIEYQAQTSMFVPWIKRQKQ
jgi:steroid 5-alpha reductase family enzyme